MVIHVGSLVPVAVSEDDGTIVYDALRTVLVQHDIVTLSFAGITTATTSFVNTALLPLLDQMSFDEIKRRVRVIDSTRQINHMIKWRLEQVSKLAVAAQ